MENNGLSFEQPLSDNEQKDLRNKNLIESLEVAVRVGDLLIAVNSMTGARRQIGSASVVSEGNRRVLRD